MKTLSCPSCGGHLELPDNLEVAHCMYCGVKILLQEEEISKERQNLKRYKDLCKTALDAKNHEDALHYCNKILEIDPKDVDAWIDKAISTIWLTTVTNNRFDESMEYLKKAANISPDTPRILEAKKEITDLQVNWLLNLGIEALDNAGEIFQIWADGTFEGRTQAQNNSADKYIEAIGYFIQALNYWPENLTILSNMARLAKMTNWITWNEVVMEKVAFCEKLQRKAEAENYLPSRRNELIKAENELTRLRGERGLFIAKKIKDAENRINQLKREISILEDEAAYQLPTANSG